MNTPLQVLLMQTPGFGLYINVADLLNDLTYIINDYVPGLIQSLHIPFHQIGTYCSVFLILMYNQNLTNFFKELNA